MTILEICEWLEGTPLGAVVRESAYGFPILVGVHILGLVASAGILLWVDVRLLGLSLEHSRVSEVYRGLAPWFLSGFAVMFVSGAALFTGFATSAYANVYFRVKIVAIVLAGLNALAFHALVRRAPGAWDATPRLPLGVQSIGLTSLVLWSVVIVAGRMMSYTMF